MNILSLLQGAFAVFMRSLVLSGDLVNLVLGIVGNLSCLVEHVFIRRGRNVEQMNVVSLVQALVSIYFTSGFVWFLFSTYVVLASHAALMVSNPAFEVEDISLNCTERAVVTYVKACSGCWLPCLRCLLNNLHPLCWHKVVLRSAFSGLLFLLLLLSYNRLCFVEVILGSLFFFVYGCTCVVKLLDFLHRLCFV